MHPEIRVFFLLVAALVGCGHPPLPPRLADLPRGRLLAGEEARRHLGRLHGRDVAPTDSFVAEYGRGRLRVYLSRYSDGVNAQLQLDRMLAGLRRGETLFTRPVPDPSTRGRWLTVSPDAHHLLWVAGNSVYWVEGEPTVVYRAADQLPLPTLGGAVL